MRPAWRGWLRGGLRVLAWLVTLASAAALTAAVLVPRATGAIPYAVLTGSMRPGLPPGTLVVVRPVDPADLAIGDVITYQLRSGRPEVVTHRVVGTGYDATGALRLRTQGDANDVADRAPVRPEQVRGRLWYSVPLLGRLGLVLSSAQRQVGVDVVAGLLGLYAVRSLVVARRRSRRRDRLREPDRVSA